MTEEENHELMKKEYDAVDMMIKVSMSHGLQVDVIMSFATHVKNGDDYITAAHCALYDWDI